MPALDIQIRRLTAYLKPYHCLGGHLLVADYGTQYFTSQTIHCECCSSRTQKNGTVFKWTPSKDLMTIFKVRPSKDEVMCLFF
ncbi:hypothetical protein [Calothrix sp. PCC 6303]|uniref:hypothetical protein n=1 Tax=Calothrix sp. PCC 6303 TaxID=1170562 RepID=UPI00130EDF4A|nr:hypothetical protein [Calothrix sp. PCC 6303]